MKPQSMFPSKSKIELLHGDCLEVMKAMSEQSVNCCVTSPPYWGLRDYGNDAQLGLEPTPDEYISKMVAVFHEVKRVLRDDGTLWLNIGDSYWSDTLSRKDPVESMWGNRPASDLTQGRDNIPKVNKRGGLGKRPEGLKPKDLVGIPWMLAFALRSDGWYLRQDIIWHKPNPMPESVRDRCTKAHEYIFLLSKNQKYFYDSDAIKEPAQTKPHVIGNIQRKLSNRVTNKKVSDCTKRNKRSVWTVTTKGYKEAHFATFPEDLIRPCILAGCPEGGTVLDPFSGAGTTCLVCKKLGRNGIGIDLNKDYCVIAQERIDGI